MHTLTVWINKVLLMNYDLMVIYAPTKLIKATVGPPTIRNDVCTRPDSPKDQGMERCLGAVWDF